MDSQDNNFFQLFSIFISIRSNIEKNYVNVCELVYWLSWKKMDFKQKENENNEIKDFQ